jgi:hypothetical protein
VLRMVLACFHHMANGVLAARLARSPRIHDSATAYAAASADAYQGAVQVPALLGPPLSLNCALTVSYASLPRLPGAAGGTHVPGDEPAEQQPLLR